MKTIHKIINGDSRQMSELEDRSVHLIITSPPLSASLKVETANLDREMEYKYKEKFKSI